MGNFNAIVVCDCGHQEFQVGVKVEGFENRIKMLACAKCGKEMEVPFQQGSEETAHE